MFKKITIIGAGLIGSSLARAIQARNLADKIIIADQSQDVCHRVKELGIANAAMTDIRQSVVGSDFVVVAVPLGAYDEVGEQIGPALAPDSVVTDVGSVKQAAIEKLGPHIPDSVHFIPAHPIAGTEHSGPDAGFAELFDQRWTILTPQPEADIRAVERATKFWEGVGARIELMDSKHHDLVLGITSHLPHLIAYTIVGTATELEDEIKSDVIKFSASGFRGFTRIAASDPTMWRDVFLNNKDAVLDILQRFNEDLTAMQKAIRRGDGMYLFDVFSQTREIRRSIMDLGPEGLPAPADVFRDLPPKKS